ncbi:unnamed protein product, partial [Amoebophrya sp. A25]
TAVGVLAQAEACQVSVPLLFRFLCSCRSTTTTGDDHVLLQKQEGRQDVVHNSRARTSLPLTAIVDSLFRLGFEHPLPFLLRNLEALSQLQVQNDLQGRGKTQHEETSRTSKAISFETFEELCNTRGPASRRRSVFFYLRFVFALYVQASSTASESPGVGVTAAELALFLDILAP